MYTSGLGRDFNGINLTASNSSSSPIERNNIGTNNEDMSLYFGNNVLIQGDSALNAALVNEGRGSATGQEPQKVINSLYPRGVTSGLSVSTCPNDISTFQANQQFSTSRYNPRLGEANQHNNISCSNPQIMQGVNVTVNCQQQAEARMTQSMSPRQPQLGLQDINSASKQRQLLMLQQLQQQQLKLQQQLLQQPPPIGGNHLLQRPDSTKVAPLIQPSTRNNIVVSESNNNNTPLTQQQLIQRILIQKLQQLKAQAHIGDAASQKQIINQIQQIKFQMQLQQQQQQQLQQQARQLSMEHQARTILQQQSLLSQQNVNNNPLLRQPVLHSGRPVANPQLSQHSMNEVPATSLVPQDMIHSLITYQQALQLQVKRALLDALIDHSEMRHKLLGCIARVNVGNATGPSYKVVQIYGFSSSNEGRSLMAVCLNNRSITIPTGSTSNTNMTEQEWKESNIGITNLQHMVTKNNYYMTGLKASSRLHCHPTALINIGGNTEIETSSVTGNVSKDTSEGEAMPVVKRTYLDTVADDDPDFLGFECTVVSLRCPITLVRMKVPVKGRNCTHAQCFDRDSFLQMMSQRKTVNQKDMCPICKQSISTTTDLVVDNALLTIIKETEGTAKEDQGAKDTDSGEDNSPCMSVAIHKDGTWSAVDVHPAKRAKLYPTEVTPSVPKAAPLSLPQEPIVIVDSDDDDA